MTYTPNVTCGTTNTQQNDGDVGTPNWVVFDGTWTENKDYRTTITYPDPIDVAQPVLRGEDMGGRTGSVRLCCISRLRSNQPLHGRSMLLYLTYRCDQAKERPYHIPALKFSHNSTLQLDRTCYSAELQDGLLGWYLVNSYMVLPFWHSDTIPGYICNYISGGGCFVMTSHGFQSASSGNAYTYGYNCLGTSPTSYPSSGTISSPNMQQLASLHDSPVLYATGTGGNVDQTSWQRQPTSHVIVYCLEQQVAHTTLISGIHYLSWYRS